MDVIKAEINSVLLSVVFALQQQIRKLLEERITNSDTWKSLENGQLRAEFGLPDDIQTRLQEILDKLEKDRLEKLIKYKNRNKTESIGEKIEENK